MALAVSVNGGSPVPADHVVLYSDGTPIAAVKQHGTIILYADAARDPVDLADILAMLGIRNVQPVKNSGLIITGNL